MKTKQAFLDSVEFDEFFRQGDEPGHGCDSIQPVVGSPNTGDDSQPEFMIRTPAQLARRAKFVRMVSVVMAVLSVGSAGAFAIKLWPAMDHTGAPWTKPALGAPIQVHQGASPKSEVISGSETGHESKSEEASRGPAKLSAPGVALTDDQSTTLSAPEVASDVAPTAARDVTATHPEVASGVARTAARPVMATRQRSAQAALNRHALLPRVSISKAPVPKPDGYHPPTASFSD